MKEKQEYSVEELLAQIDVLKRTVQLQHLTINRLLDAYVLKIKSENKKTQPPQNRRH